MLERHKIRAEIYEESDHSKGDTNDSPPSTKSSLKTKKIKKTEKNTKQRKLSKTEWTKQEKANFFAAVLQFQITNPRLLVSWANQKPKFYPNIEKIMERISGSKSRNSNQIKSKDQNFKNKHFKSQENPTDLLPLALEEVKEEIKDLQSQPNSSRKQILTQIYNQFMTMRTENIYAYANEFMERQTQSLLKIRQAIRNIK